MHIAHIASELTPCAKVGGLADVLLGLSRELKRRRHKVTLIIPKYSCLNKAAIENFKKVKNNLWEGEVEGLKVSFIDLPKYFRRKEFYGCKDDVPRFLHFAKAALEHILELKKRPDLINLHDWQTAIIAPLCKLLYPKEKIPILTTIHNMQYQGWCTLKDLKSVGLFKKRTTLPTEFKDHHRPSDANLLKAATYYSDWVSTVSPSYAKEIETAPGGRGLEKTVAKHKAKFSGILNGIDNDYWDPLKDPLIPHNFSTKNLFGKAANKHAIQKLFGLAEERRPLVACITRLVPQKGVELIKHALYRTVELGGQFVILGSSPIKSIIDEFQCIQKRFAHHKQVHIELIFNEERSHKLFAGADMFIIPSLFEPCGLTQMISMRYGTIPIARNTGGLTDTVFDVDYSTKAEKMRNGYLFDHPDKTGIESALDRAIADWFSHSSKWDQLVKKVMQLDHSWKNPAKDYLSLYKQLIKEKQTIYA